MPLRRPPTKPRMPRGRLGSRLLRAPGVVATDLVGLGVAQGQSMENVVLAVMEDRRPRILGQSFVPIEQSTW